MELLDEKDTKEIACKLYELAIDMDYMDYEDEKEKIIAKIEEAIYNIKTIAKNEHNKDYWRILYNILERI